MCLAGRFCDAGAAERAFFGFTSRSVLPNFFAFHPPVYFQIDGNLGFPAAINETLVTCDNGTLTMLPALLKVMPDGKVHSLAVGGALLDFEWKDRQIVFLKANKPVRVRSLNLSPSVVLQNAEVVL